MILFKYIIIFLHNRSINKDTDKSLLDGSFLLINKGIILICRERKSVLHHASLSVMILYGQMLLLS